jgi:hypothetical protein
MLYYHGLIGNVLSVSLVVVKHSCDDFTAPIFLPSDVRSERRFAEWYVSYRSYFKPKAYRWVIIAFAGLLISVFVHRLWLRRSIAMAMFGNRQNRPNLFKMLVLVQTAIGVAFGILEIAFAVRVLMGANHIENDYVSTYPLLLTGLAALALSVYIHHRYLESISVTKTKELRRFSIVVWIFLLISTVCLTAEIIPGLDAIGASIFIIIEQLCSFAYVWFVIWTAAPEGHVVASHVRLILTDWMFAVRARHSSTVNPQFLFLIRYMVAIGTCVFYLAMDGNGFFVHNNALALIMLFLLEIDFNVRSS